MIYTTVPRPLPVYGHLLDAKNFGSDGAPVFLYYELDHNQFGLTLAKSFNPEVWAELRNNPRARLLIGYTGDFLNLHDIHLHIEAIEEHAIPQEQIVYAVMDHNFAELVKRHLPGATVKIYNELLSKVELPKTSNVEPSFRFSSLSRNYRPWRLGIYLGLLTRNVLPNTNYSFHNIDPYKNYITRHDEMLAHAQQLGYDVDSVEEWVRGVPYDLDAPVTNKFSNATYQAIQEAGIHLLVESHFNPFEYWKNFSNIDPRLFSPGFATEKTYKVMACARPFIAVTTPYFLESLRKLGFKTFSPWINEDYDLIVDGQERMLAILTEVERINGLPEEEYQALLAGVAQQVQHNYELFNQLKQDYCQLKLT